MANTQQRFTEIYQQHVWGGNSPSGPGSDPRLLQTYLQLLVRFLEENKIQSVVDLGCGDWSLAATIDWGGISYTGVEIVPALVARLNHTHGTENIRFICADLTTDELPGADLCIAKDVLQHLTNDAVKAFLARMPERFQRALLTNDISHHKQGGWWSLWRTDSIDSNSVIPNGGYRPLRLRDAPFHLPAKELAVIPLEFKRPVFGHPGTVFEAKEVLLWERAS